MALRYVRTSGGSDTNGGTSVADGWATLEKASSSVSAGDTILLCVMSTGETFSSETDTVVLDVAGGAGTVIVWSGANSSGDVDGTIAVFDFTSVMLTQVVTESAVAIHVNANNQIFRYISIENAADATATNGASGWSTTSSGITQIAWHKCKAVNNSGDGFETLGQSSTFIECVADGNGSGAPLGQNGGFKTSNKSGQIFYGCVSKNNAGFGFDDGSASNIIYCISYNNGNDGFLNPLAIINCVSYNNGGDGITSSTTDSFYSIINCISVSNAGYGYDGNDIGSSNNIEPKFAANNAFYNNATGVTRGDPVLGASVENGIITNTIILTTDPFIDAANGNFELNNALGGGVLCKGAGLTTNFVGTSTDPNTINTTTAIDLGAVQAEFRSIVVN